MAKQTVIACWSDDPANDTLLQTTAPDLTVGSLPVVIRGRTPAVGIHQTGSKAFLWWNAAEALRRAREFWLPLVPTGIRWMTGATLPVNLDQGDQLNANYNRAALNFFHSSVAGKIVYSAESPDVVAHEFGHALLDALQPALWDAMGVEAAAFHESFGDMCALLAALQVPDIRTSFLDETDGQLHRASRISRVAEQLGWALRTRRPGAAEEDCLRNAANSFYYKDTSLLPPTGPATVLTSQPHSFSRIFTGAFLEILDGVYKLQPAGVPDASLVAATQDLGRILVAAVLKARIVPEYYSQVAASMIGVDQSLNDGRYGHVLRSAFARRGILSVESATSLTGSSVAATSQATARGIAETASSKVRKAGAAPAELPVQAFPGSAFGLAAPALLVRSPSQPREFAAAPSALDEGSLQPHSSTAAARSYLEDLYRLGRIDTNGHEAEATLIHPFTTKSHELRQEGTSLFVARRFFDCGFDPIL